MEKSYLLGFDAGTYESKGTLCDIKGNVVATAFSPHLLKVPKPGYAEHDPINDWWVDFKKIVKDLLEKSGSIRAGMQERLAKLADLAEGDLDRAAEMVEKTE